jgi:peptide/nickel transport system substrate-binding protein
MIVRSPVVRLLSSLLAILSIALLGVVTSADAIARSAALTCPKHNAAAGTIKYSDWEFPDTLNPAQTSLLVTTEITNATFDGLFQYDNRGKLITQLAAEIPTVANGGITNGGKTITVRLKQGQRWSDGSEFTSKDVLFSWKISSDKNSGPACLGTCDVISRIDTPNKYTVVFHLKQPYAAAISNAINGFLLWPSKFPGAWNGNVHAATNSLFQDTKFNFEGPDYPTNGAYQVAPGGYSQNDRIVLRPMKYYADMNCGGYTKSLIFVFYASKPGMIAAAVAGQTDVTFDYTPADLPELSGRTGAYKVHSDRSYSFEHLEMNVDPKYQGKDNPLHNATVRVALALGLDKLGLIQSALSVSAKEAKLIESWSPWVNTPPLIQPFADTKLQGQWDPLAKKFLVDTGHGQALADAKKLLAGTPYKGGFGLDLYSTSGNPTRQAQEAVVAKSWAQLNVTVNPNYVPASKLFASFNQSGIAYTGNFQVAMFALTGSPEPDGLKLDLQSKYIDRDQSVHSNINSNYGGIRDSVIDKQFDVGAHSYDPKVRKNAYYAVQVQLNKQAYWIGLFYRPTIATENGHVLNFSTNPTSSPEWNVYNWRPKAG